MTRHQSISESDVRTLDPPPTVWPPPDRPGPPAQTPPAHGAGRWLSRAALFVGIVAVIGAFLPAIDGHKSGDPDSVAFQVGAPLGFFGGILAIALGVYCRSRSAIVTSARTVAIAAIVVGAYAIFMTAALLFSG